MKKRANSSFIEMCQAAPTERNIGKTFFYKQIPPGGKYNCIRHHKRSVGADYLSSTHLTTIMGMSKTKRPPVYPDGLTIYEEAQR